MVGLVAQHFVGRHFYTVERLGLRQSFHVNGQTASLGRVIDGRPEGWWLFTYPGWSTERQRGERHIAVFDSTGYEAPRVKRLGRYTKGKRHGYWLYLGPRGQLDEERSGLYEDDKRVGPFDRGSFTPYVEGWPELPAAQIAGVRFPQSYWLRSSGTLKLERIDAD